MAMHEDVIKVGRVEFTPFGYFCFLAGTASWLTCGVSTFFPWSRFFDRVYAGYEAWNIPQIYDGTAGTVNLLASLVVLATFALFIAVRNSRSLNLLLGVGATWTALFFMWLVYIRYRLDSFSEYGLYIALVSSALTALLYGFLLAPLRATRAIADRPDED